MPPKRPLIAVTQGDPAGVGPEIIVAAWKEPAVHQWCRPLVVGHPEVLRRAVELWEADLRVVEIDSPDKAAPSPGQVRVGRRSGRSAPRSTFRNDFLRGYVKGLIIGGAGIIVIVLAYLIFQPRPGPSAPVTEQVSTPASK